MCPRLQFVNYIRCGIGAYIDTELVIDKMTYTIEVDYYTEKIDTWIYGSKMPKPNNVGIFFNAQNPDTYFAYNTLTKGFHKVTTGRHISRLNKTGLYIDGSYVATNTNNQMSTYSIWLFQLNQNGSPEGRYTDTTRIYYFKVWDDNTLIRNMKPCVFNGQIGMYDTVTAKFYGNSGKDKLYTPT